MTLGNDQTRIPPAKSVGVAYLLWFPLGLFGANNFYMGRPIAGIAKLFLTLVPLTFFAVGAAILFTSSGFTELMEFFTDEELFVDGGDSELTGEQADMLAELLMDNTAFIGGAVLMVLAGFVTLITWAAVAVWLLVELLTIPQQVASHNLERTIRLSKHGLS